MSVALSSAQPRKHDAALRKARCRLHGSIRRLPNCLLMLDRRLPSDPVVRAPTEERHYLVDSRRFGLDAGLRPLTPTLPPFRLLDAIHISGCLFMNKSARNPRSKDDPCLPSVRGERVARQAIVGVSFP